MDGYSAFHRHALVYAADTLHRSSVDGDSDAQLTARRYVCGISGPMRPKLRPHCRPSVLDLPSLTSGGSLGSSRHKFSDSYSSLSSYAPSSQSGGHSRMSSFTTVGIMHSANSSSVGEIPCIEEHGGGDESTKWGQAPVSGESWPTTSGLPVSSGLPFRFATLNDDGPRPRSPSDAFLISRPAQRPSLDRNYLL